MEIKEQREGDRSVVAISGRIDHATVREVEQQLLRSIEQGARRIVIELGGLEYISSAGLRVLLTVAKKLKGCGGKVVLCAVRQYVKEVLDISGFSTIFTICATQAEALVAVQQPG